MNNIQKKQTIVSNLAKKLKNAHFYITDSQGLNVEQINYLRKICYEKGIHYQVIKNTLLRRVLASYQDQEINHAPLQEKVIKGFSSIFITTSSASEPAKIIQTFHKTKNNIKPILKGALVNGELYIGSASLDVLSKIKSKEALIIELISLLQSPAKRLIASLKGPQNELSSIIKALLPS